MKKNKGITLIALVITIIVLLILAGVTINAIVGNESAMEKAKQAKEENDKGNELDTIKLAVTDAMVKGLNGLVDADSLKNELNGLIDETSRNAITSSKTAWIVTTNSGLKYKIKQNGEVTSAEPVDTVEFEKAIYEVEKDSKVKLTIIAKDKFGNETEAVNTIFESNKPSIASVNETTGEVEGIIVSDEKVTITVNADGKIAACEIIVVPASIPATQANINTSTMIGADVINYTVNNVNDWQVFYATHDEVFIISKNVLETNIAINNCNDEYTNGSEDFAKYTINPTDEHDLSYGSEWNSAWLSQCTTKNTNNNTKTVAYLCDKMKWATYVSNAAPSGTYAVGGPTVQLLVESLYEKTKGTSDEKDYRNKYNGADDTYLNSNGYLFSSSVFYRTFRSPHISNNYYWLASPGINSGDIISGVGVTGSGSGLNYDSIGNSYGIRPLVSIPMQNVRIYGDKVKIIK